MALKIIYLIKSSKQKKQINFLQQNQNRNLRYKSLIQFNVKSFQQNSLHSNFKTMNYIKDINIMRRYSKKLFNHIQNMYLFSSSQLKAQFVQKLEQGRYYDILGLERKLDSGPLSDNQLKRQYLAMIKKYHSDGITDPFEKLDNEQITKCIILAYDKITQARVQQKIDKGIYDNIYQDQDQIAMKIFGKKFNQIKYQLFRQDNVQKRNRFMQQLQKIRKQSRYYQYVKNKRQQTSDIFNQRMRMSRVYSGGGGSGIKFAQTVQKQIAKNYLPGFAAAGILLVIYYFKKNYDEEQERQIRKKQKHTLGYDKIKQIQKKSTALYQKKLNDLIDSYVQQQPPSLKYPAKGDPQQIDQLIEYTIGPDIYLYEVSSNLLGNQQNLQKLKNMKTQQQVKHQFGRQFDPFSLSKIKVNSLISLSLQAERCLQNIYIKVKDVADQIQQTGRYQPPKIFFRFYGYVMFQIRQKPLSLQNYRDTQYISLFDLLFDYYSPIPLKRHQYNQYLVGYNDQDLKMYGQVHLNHRKIPQRYITKQNKIVIMRDNVGFQEHKYQQIWNDFYRKYMRIWRRGYGDRISTQYKDPQN